MHPQSTYPRRRWSVQDDDYLRAHYLTDTAAAIARVLGRTAHAVRRHGARLLSLSRTPGRALHRADLTWHGEQEAFGRRFWERVDCRGPQECWAWLGCQNQLGRGVVNVGRHRTAAAPRVAYVLTHGVLPSGYCIRHLCDQALCVNPAHLIAGTNRENRADQQRAARTDRAVSGVTRPARRRYSTLGDKLAAGVSVAEPDACWLWSGYTTPRGYGLVTLGTRGRAMQSVMAHRLAYIQAYGDVPPGLVVRHLCEDRYEPTDPTYRRCCNPAHLAAGTPSENAYDAVASGRQGSGSTHWSHQHPERRLYGERNPACKVTAEQVRAIRQRRAAGESCRVIAADYGVSPSLVGRIATGVARTHG